MKDPSHIRLFSTYIQKIFWFYITHHRYFMRYYACMQNDHSLRTSETDIFYSFFFQTTKDKQIFNSATCKHDKTALKQHFYYYLLWLNIAQNCLKCTPKTMELPCCVKWIYYINCWLILPIYIRLFAYILPSRRMPNDWVIGKILPISTKTRGM